MSLNRLSGLVSVVTGSGAGIGKSIAEFFAEEGSKVVVVDIDAGGGKTTAETINKNGGEAVFLHIDISKDGECKNLADEAVKHFGKSPGSVYTEASHRHASTIGISIDQFKAEQGKMNVQNRMADPREIAAPVLFLASKEASFITGTDLLVDGGYTLT